MKHLALIPSLLIGLLLCSCSTGINMPSGTIDSYQSANLISRNPYAEKFGSAASQAHVRKVHSMIQGSIKSEFQRNGVQYGKKQSDLAVAYLILVQNRAITYHYNDYFGHGPNANEIAKTAHERGVMKKEVSDYHNKAGILIDVIDTKTNKIVYRNFYATDIVHIPSDSIRANRIRQAVQSALAPFFVRKS
ncbi:DUF4136 domain-containing protein [Verrucomicrobiaceae bacterium N1E253]|uniref:DUF4136 domain-containing protein n=1 Tax=Oceaniferula marina TaxID=2748318 RepID=A0A851GKT3_9BACT|nr:DUF4136 domain-containing protein [Oceaniferula marina]NWK55785.1 DUF4136 domain-containing protein [Oceaniferula marina]